MQAGPEGRDCGKTNLVAHTRFPEPILIQTNGSQMAGVMKAAPAGLETLCLDGFCNPIGESVAAKKKD